MITPRPYQLEGRDFLAGRRHALLGDEMRVGKTGQAILAAHKAGATSMVVVTRAIAVPQWEREIERWWPSGSLPRRAVLSYERATSLWKDGLRGRTDVFIPDECHFAKNPEAARTKMVYGKDGFAWNAGATWALSGTPAPKHAGELWPMLRAFGVVGATYDEFVRHYCTQDFTGRITGTKVKHIPELKQILAKVMLRRTRKQVAPEMPDIGFNFLTVEYEKGVDYQVYGDDDDSLAAWVESHQDFDREDRIAVANAKVPRLADEIEFAVTNGLLKQTVVFGWHVEPLTRLTDRLLERGLTSACINGQSLPRAKEYAQNAFRQGEIQVICANINTAGTAIDLSAANHGYFLELAWVPGDNAQAANRLVSMSKSDPVTLDVVTMPDTADDRVQKVLLRRTQELANLY